MAKLLYRLGFASAKRPWVALVSWLVALGLAVGGFLAFGGTLSSTVTIPNTPTAQVTDRLAEEFPDASKGSGGIIFQTEDGSEFTDDQRDQIDALLDEVSAMEGIDSTVSPFATEAELENQRQELADGRDQVEQGREQAESGREQLEQATAQLDAAEAELDAGQEQLDAGRAQAEAAGMPEAAMAQFDQQQQQLDAGREDIESSRAEIAEQEEALEQGLTDAAEGEEALDLGERLLALTEDYSLVSEDGSTAEGTVMFTAASTDVDSDTSDALTSALDEADIEGVEILPSQAISQSMPQIIGVGEVIGLIVAAIVLVIMLGTFVTAGLPLLNALIGVGVGAVGALAFSSAVEMMSVTPVLGIMLGLAVGIDYALFIVNRHRRQLKSGLSVLESAGLANGTSGNAVVFAGTTVVIALAALNITGIPFLGLMGTVGAACVAIAVLVAITLTPALLGWIGHRALSRTERKVLAERTSSGEHTAYSAATKKAIQREQVEVKPMSTARAVLTTLGTVALLAVIALPFFDMRLGLPDGSSEPEDSASYQSYVATAEAFGEGRNGPLVVTVDLPEEAAGDENAILSEQATIGEQLGELDHVAAVVPAAVNDDETIAMFQVIPEEGPNAVSTEELIHTLRDTTPDTESTHLSVAGMTSGFIDVSEALSEALPTYLGVVVGLSLIIMVLVFRSILVPLIATGGFVLSVFAAMGGVVAIYQWGWLGEIFGVHSPGPVLSFLPTIMIGVLFGLAMDYQLFIASGMREAYAHGSPARLAVQEGFRAGRAVVAAAAIIMISVFGGFIFAHDAMIRPMGFGLAFGVLLDAFVVRMVLMPALMHLLGNSAWWLPKWLDKIMPNVDVEGAELERDHPGLAGADPQQVEVVSTDRT
ncbi:MMPL family transporter [Citricoccus muralis]|uniref:MMPL family transporter n=1 Tax=Citricoccus muralis TaxID=169134 RepID=A0ABY8H4I9_9MICC|nr:MMPL family transporter [Citricoccus muralis]WFP16058.1 MMPL family transporter [Citricoccus muralis]